jgi:uncharacterized Zn ribbon protein
MEDTVTCPKCLDENAYFNGAEYECSNCDYKWNDQQYKIEDEDDYLEY